jgi:hypothetical protein
VRDGDVSETQYERLKEDEKQYQEEAGNDVRGLDVQCCNPTIQITRGEYDRQTDTQTHRQTDI